MRINLSSSNLPRLCLANQLRVTLLEIALTTKLLFAISVAVGLGCSAETSSGNGLTSDSGVDGGARGEVSVPADSASPDTTPALPAFLSDPSGASYVNVKPDSGEGLVLVSSRFSEKPSGDDYFRNWFGEVRNTGSKIHCYARVKVSLKDSSGTEIATFNPFADTAPFRLGTSTLSTPCLAPGGRGAFYANGFSTTAANVSSIRRIEVEFSSMESPEAVPDPVAPVLESAMVASTSLGYRVSGTLRARETINNIGIDVYPLVGGVPYEQLSATNLDEVAKGATWAYETRGITMPFTEFMQFPSYIRGPSTAFAPSAPSADSFSPEEAAFRDAHAQRIARAALHAKRVAGY